MVSFKYCLFCYVFSFAQVTGKARGLEKFCYKRIVRVHCWRTSITWTGV